MIMTNESVFPARYQDQHLGGAGDVLGFWRTLRSIACESLWIHPAFANLGRLMHPLLCSLSEFLQIFAAHKWFIFRSKYGKW